MASPTLLGVPLDSIFAGCEPWHGVLLGGPVGADGRPAGKAALAGAFRGLREHVAAWGLRSWHCGDVQFVYPYIGNIFGAFRMVPPETLRLIVVASGPLGNSGLVLDGCGRFGPADKRIWAAAGVLMIGRALTSSPPVIAGSGVCAVDPAGAAVPHDFWREYCDGLVARVAVAYPGVPVITLERIPGVPRAICGDWTGSVARLDATLQERLGESVPMRRALMYAVDGSCRGNGSTGAVASWGMYCPKTYAGVANPVACALRGDVPDVEYIWKNGRGVPGDAPEETPDALKRGTPVLPSNNRAEMLGMVAALESATEYLRAHPYHGMGVHIVCDSDYTIGTVLSWCWTKAANDYAAVAKNRDLVRVLHRMLIAYAELLRPGCGDGAREALFAPWQTMKMPGSGSRDYEPFHWPGITIFIQRSHQRLPAQSADWRENLSHERAAANAVADRLASQVVTGAEEIPKV